MMHSFKQWLSSLALIMVVVWAAAALMRPAESASITGSEDRSEVPAEAPTVPKEDIPLGKAVDSHEPAVVAGASVARVATTVKELRRLENCMVSMRCEFSRATDNSYSTELDLAIATRLRELQGLMEAGGASEREAGMVEVRRFMEFGGNFVKTEALAVLSAFPTSPENFRALEKGLVTTVDGVLFSQGLDEMRRYLDTPMQPAIDRFVVTRLDRGGHAVGREMAKDILDFLNPNTAPAVEKILAKLPPRSKNRLFLQYNLQEYRRLHPSK